MGHVRGRSRGWALVVLAAACGRVGFEPVTATDVASRDGGSTTDGTPSGDTMGGDGGMTIACADMNLGSTLGPAVASGSTMSAGNDYTGCSGDGNDITFGWFAPSAGMYRFDVCNSPSQFWDSVLSVRAGSCTGQQLACNDDACGGAGQLQSRVTVSLAAGQGVVIVVDSLVPLDGMYQLAITQL
jgi:hypothetical protein